MFRVDITDAEGFRVIGTFSTAAAAIRTAYAACPAPLRAWIPNCTDDRYDIGTEVYADEIALFVCGAADTNATVRVRVRELIAREFGTHARAALC